MKALVSRAHIGETACYGITYTVKLGRHDAPDGDFALAIVGSRSYLTVLWGWSNSAKVAWSEVM